MIAFHRKRSKTIAMGRMRANLCSPLSSNEGEEIYNSFEW
jgi:hypothetical protein